MTSKPNDEETPNGLSGIEANNPSTSSLPASSPAQHASKAANGKPRLLMVTKYRVATFGFRTMQSVKFYEFELLRLLAVQVERDEGTWMFDGNVGVNVNIDLDVTWILTLTLTTMLTWSSTSMSLRLSGELHGPCTEH